MTDGTNAPGQGETPPAAGVPRAGPGDRPRDVRLLRAAYLISTMGDWIYRFALPLFVLKLTGSALSTALTYVLEFLPYIVVGLFVGVVADRVDRRRLMIACDVSSAVVVGLIALIFTGSHPPVVALYAAAFVLACVRPFYFPAMQGFLVDRVAEAQRPGVNAWLQGTDSALNMLGPIAGFGMVALIGPVAASSADAVSFVLSAGLLALTAAAVGGQAGRFRDAARGVGTDFLAGLRVLVRISALLWGTALMTLTNFAAIAVEANLVYVLVGPGRQASVSLGLVFALNGGGALIGSTAAPALMRRFPVGRLLVSAMALFAVALALPALSRELWLVSVSWLLVGIATSTIIVPWTTFRQKIVPNHMIGRVASVGRSLSYVAIPLGAAAGSFVVTSLGRPQLFLAAGAVQAVVWLATVFSPLGKAGAPEVSGGHTTPLAEATGAVEG